MCPGVILPYAPSPSPFVSPITPLKENANYSLEVLKARYVNETCFAITIVPIRIKRLVDKTIISVIVGGLPDNETGKGTVNYLLTYPNGTVFSLDRQNVSWYDFAFSPFIYTDWDGWKHYIYAWQNGSIKGYSNVYDIKIYEDETYFAFIEKYSIKKDKSSTYELTRIRQKETWFLKSNGTLQYTYILLNDTYVYFNKESTREMFYFEMEMQRPGFVHPLKITSTTKNHFVGFLWYDFLNVFISAIFMLSLVITTTRKNR